MTVGHFYRKITLKNKKRGRFMNQQQKYILNLQRKSRERKREQAFVIEGRKMFEEAPADRIKMIVASESFCKSKEGRCASKGKEI